MTEHHDGWSTRPGAGDLRRLVDDPRFAGVDLDAEFDPEAMDRELREQRQRLEDAQQELARSVFRMRSPDGYFEITVRGGASIDALDIHPDALREYQAREIGPLIVALIGEAMAHGAQTVRETFGRAFQDSGQFDAIFDSWPSATSDAERAPGPVRDPEPGISR